MEKVEARLAALELAVDELRKQLEHERARIRTMRMTHMCPACQGKRILRFRRINEAGGKGLVPLSLDTKHSTWWGTQEGHPLEAYVCRDCGLVEWQAPGVKHITPDARTIIELVYQEPSSGGGEPYR
jgi:hypothetical protein